MRDASGAFLCPNVKSYLAMVYIRNQSRHLLAMVEVPGLRDLEQRMNEALKKYDEYLLV